MIVAGIDEAGYGPVLGPLVTALSAFSGPAEALDDLWRALRPAVRKRPPTGRSASWRALPVVDSKELHRGGAGFADLEIVALAFSAWAGGRAPRTVGEFLGRHLVGGRLPLASTPWYGDAFPDRSLPRTAEPGRIDREVKKLARAATRARVSPTRIAVRPLLADEFNRRSESCGTKAQVLFQLNVDLLEDLRGRSTPPFRVRCDRHGGRRHYADLLESAFPMEGVSILGEHRARSRYRVGRPEEGLEVEYVVGGEREGLEVALASIFAKYTRELFVEALNDHFADRVDGLKRTAGYWVDGHRFVKDLEDAGALREDERVRLVRRR